MANAFIVWNVWKAFLLKKLSLNHSIKKFLTVIILLSINFCFVGNKALADETLSSLIKPKVKPYSKCVSAVGNYFRSIQSGDWNNPSTWETSTDNLSWSAATEIPTQDASTITVRNGNTVFIRNSVSLDETIVEGVLELQTGGILNINDGVGDDIVISQNGVLKVVTTGTYSNSIKQAANADVSIGLGGKITVGDGILLVGSGYENFATSAVNKWNDAAIFEYNNNSVFKLSNLKFFPNSAEKEIPVFRISKANGSFTIGTDFHLNGLLELNTDVNFKGSAKSYFRNGISGNSTLTQSGTGKFYLTADGAILDGINLKLVLSAIMDLSPNTIIPDGARVTITEGDISNSSCTLTIDGILEMVTNNITNSSGSIIINGTYKTAHPGGFSGIGSSIPATNGTITLNPGSTIELFANGNQALNTRDDFSNLIFSGSGIKTPKGPFEPHGTITIKDNAIFDCSGNINGTNIGNELTNLTMTGNSRLIVSSTGTNPKMAGIYNLTGGVIEFKGSNLTPQTIRNEKYQNIEVTGTNVSNSDGHITLNANGSFTVKNGGSFTINDNSIKAADLTNGQVVTVENNATFRCGNKMGFHGFIPNELYNFSSIHGNISKIILEKGSTVEYCRTNPPLSDGDQVITNANGLIYQNLILSATGNITAPSDNLIIEGNFSKTSASTFVHNNGTVIFNGSDQQNYSSISPQVVFNNLTNKNSIGLNVNDSLSVYKNLLLDDFSVITLNADISLKSDKDQNAFISRLGTNAKIVYTDGRFIVERYINTNTKNGGHGKSWQLLSTPAFGETILNTWQEKGNNNIVGYGTWITGVSNPDNSFDAISPLPAMKYYDSEKNIWIGISSTKINLENEKGYMLFISGDRMARTFNSPPTPTILRTRGKLYEDEFTPPASIIPANKFQCIGNPYASAIDFSKIYFSNNQTSYIAWDPTLYGSYGVGGYQTISATTYFKAIPGNTYNYNTSSDYRNIQSGQAFFVYNSSADPVSVSFPQNCKLDDGYHLVNRQSFSKRSILTARLFSNEHLIADGNAVAFDEIFSNKIDENDALKITKGGENFGIKKDQKLLAIEAKESIKEADTVFYQLSNLLKKEYYVKFYPEKFEPETEAYLIDKYLNEEKQINLNDTSVVTFSVNSDVASGRADRFYMVFKQPAAKAEMLFDISAYRKYLNVILEWEKENDANLKEYQIEHGKDENNLSLIKVYVADSNLTLNTFVHKQPVNGDNFYRIKKVCLDGKVQYSKTVKVSMPEYIPGVKIFPNPAKDGIINLQFINQPQGKYQINLFNYIGQLILSKEINYEGGNGLEKINYEKKLARGIYHLQLIKPDGKQFLLKLTR